MPPFILVVLVAIVVGVVLGLEYVFLPADSLRLAITLTVAVVLVTGAGVAAGVVLLERKRRRNAEGLELQSRIVAALRADPRVADVPVLPVVSVPVRRGDVTRIQLEGAIPSPETRAAVLEVAERETRKVYPRYDIVDRLRLPDERAAGRRTA